jgi:hypothetical protein
MEPKAQERAPRISGVNVSGEAVDVDYSSGLMNVVLFFEPVTRLSLETVERIRVMSTKYEKLSVSFWYVMEPRLSCMSRAEVAQRTLDRLSLFSNTIFDANNMVALYSGVRTVPTVLVVDSNGFLSLRHEGEVSLTEIERTVQSRIALSGYRDELPVMQRAESMLMSPRVGIAIRNLGYASGDYVFGNMVVPESAQDFLLPDFYLLNTIYPFGAWYVSRDFIEGKSGSTVYISCGKNETVSVFAGSEDGAALRVHTSIELASPLSLGKDVKKNGSLMETVVDECRPYEIVSNSGDTDVLVSLQIMSGSMKLFSVEFCPARVALQSEQNFRPVRS